MCGICGVIQVGGPRRRVLAPGVLDRMTDTMTHRGPSDRGTYEADGIAIGARRLSIIDVEGGHQPFANEDGTVWAAQNGELYNHVEIRRTLERQGHQLRSRCDTEILPHMYEHWGVRFAEELRGMWGLVVWDDVRGRAILVRDRLGIKPLYYAHVGDLIVYGSELKSVLASGLVDLALDHDAIAAYLTFGFVPGPLTPLAAVKKLMPGERLVVEDGRVTVERYWSYPEPAPDLSLGMEDAAELLLNELEASVRLRLMSDVPLGAMLSGGLDSSLIVALMARNMSGPVQTFSVGFTEAGRNNELADAREVAAGLGAEHHELELSMADRGLDLEGLVWHLDEPLADLSSLGFLALCELAVGDVTVALSGQGADELLGGYAKHRAAALTERFERLPRPLVAAGRAIARRSPGRAASALAAPDAVERLLAMSGRLDERILHGQLAAAGLSPARAAVAARLGSVRSGALADTLFIDGQLALVDDMLHYFDRTSMAHSLEVRVPFLDHKLVELAATIPSGLKVRGLETKAVLKHAARGLVPDRIVDKRKIGFFRQSVDGWFHEQARGAVADYLLGPSPRYAELLDRSAVEGLVRAQLDGKPGGDPHLLLSVLMLEVWLSSYLPRAVAAPAATPASVVVRS